LLFTLAKRDESNLEIAAKQYGLAFNVIDSLRATYSERSSKLDKADEYADLFEGAIECYFQLGKAEGRNYQSNLFELFEKDKSLLLLEALNETFAQQFAGIPEEVLAKEQYLKAELAVLDEEKFYENQMGPDKDEAIINDLNGQIFDLKKQLNSFSNQLEQDYPEYYKLKYSWNINSLSEVQESLSADEIMLTFYVGNENSYVLFISNDDSWVHKYESIQTEELGQQIVALREGIYSYFLLSSSEQDQETYQSYLTVYQQAAFELYETLFVPIEKELTGKRLILIPDGVLGYVPFDALLSSKPNSDAALKDYDYLIKQFNLAYSYSASSLLRFKELKTSNNLKSLLAFAPSFEEQGEALASRRIRGVLTPLKYNVSEVEAIKALVRGDIVTGQEATKDAFLEKAPDYSILHLSTHGKANDKVGDFSYLAFAKGAGTVDESLLYVRDLYTLNLNADMVVLSACETGIGELQNGEGIASLSSGFSYAGAKNIITTLWSVNDAQTKDLINRFYSLLTEGIDKATALQKAKLNYINEVPKAKSHPFYWSGFISIGDQEKINFSTSPSLINLLLYFAPFLIIIFIAIGGVSIIRKNTTNFF
ncbi:MAG: CHAT domain-containing protein, partial [Bacteroidota bacterium]